MDYEQADKLAAEIRQAGWAIAKAHQENDGYVHIQAYLPGAGWFTVSNFEPNITGRKAEASNG